MKKIFMKFSAGTTLAVAIALTACNNAEEVKKQVDAQNATIQTLVDEKLNGLQEQVNAECTAKVEAAANAAYTEWYNTEGKKKGAKKPAPKPAPKPVVVEETKKEEPKKGDKGVIGTKGDSATNKIVGTKGDTTTNKIVGTKK